MISVVVWLVLAHAVACGTDIVSNSTNNRHSQGVSRVRFDSHLGIVATSSYDQTIGIWGKDLSDCNLLDKSVWEVYGRFNGEEILSQVTNIEWAVFNQTSYLVANLMGNYLKVFKIDQATRTLKEVKLLEYPSEVFGSRSWTPIPSTSKLLIGLSTKLLVQDFLTGEVYSSTDFGNRISSMCLINNEELIISQYRQILLFDISQKRVIETQKPNGTPLYIVALEGTNSGQPTEIAVSMPMSVLEVYQYNQISFGRKRYYTRLHGYHESLTLAPVHHTPYVISGSGALSIIIFDIVNSPSGPASGLIISSRITTSASVNSIDYIKGTNTFFASYSGSIDTPAIIRVERFSFCRDSRCIQCSPFNLCEKCAIGFYPSDANLDNICIDCSLPSNIDQAACKKVRRYLMASVGKNEPEHAGTNVLAEGGIRINLKHTSTLIKISIENVESFKPVFKYNRLSSLSEKFSFEIQTLSPTIDYSFVYFVNDIYIYLAINFTQDVRDKELSLSIRNPVIIEMNSNEGSLLILNETKTLTINAYSQTDPSLATTIDTLTTSSAYATTAAIGAAAGVALLSLCCPFAFGAAFYGFFQTVQVVSCYARSCQLSY